MNKLIGIIGLFVLFILLCSSAIFFLGGLALLSEDSSSQSLPSTQYDAAESTYEDFGDFYPVYNPTINYDSTKQTYQSAEFLESLSSLTNDMFVLPYDVKIEMSECGEINAFYSPYNKSITLCYELSDYLLESFLLEGYGVEETARMTANTMLFVYYHELAHALIDVYDIPVVGKEEDAADQFAAFLLLYLFEDEKSQAATMLVDSATWFYLESSSETTLAFWDEHSLNQQRFYNILCWVYGSDEAAFSDILSVLPQDRAERCYFEYKDLDENWKTLLKGKIKI